MTVKKAIRILDWWINQKKNGIEKLRVDWNFNNDDHGIAKTLLDADKITISNLETIRNELVPDCKHPTNMQDQDPTGHKYCMNCNLDL